MKQKEIFGYLQNITNDHVISAMRKLDREEIPRRRQ
jgi:hypothetical protein